jgi:hypothetical protein
VTPIVHRDSKFASKVLCFDQVPSQPTLHYRLLRSVLEEDELRPAGTSPPKVSLQVPHPGSSWPPSACSPVLGLASSSNIDAVIS